MDAMKIWLIERGSQLELSSRGQTQSRCTELSHGLFLCVAQSRCTELSHGLFLKAVWTLLRSLKLPYLGKVGPLPSMVY